MRILPLLALVLALSALAGCEATKDAHGRIDAASAGENFGNSGRTRCGTRSIVDGWVPGCGQPNDGDGTYGMFPDK